MCPFKRQAKPFVCSRFSRYSKLGENANVQCLQVRQLRDQSVRKPDEFVSLEIPRRKMGKEDSKINDHSSDPVATCGTIQQAGLVRIYHSQNT